LERRIAHLSAKDWPPAWLPAALPLERSVFDNVTTVSLTSALDNLALRQRVTADNIANIETPNFHARRVSFENALADNVNGGGDGNVQATVASSLEPTREDGNNVNLDTETLSDIDTGLRYQLALRAMDSQFSVLKTSIGA
jgi:flagellar basal-body rod protein FlgB